MDTAGRRGLRRHPFRPPTLRGLVGIWPVEDGDVLFAVEAAKLWASDGVTVNALMPGGIRTGLQRYMEANLTPEMQAIFENYPWKTVEQRAATSVLLAASPLIAGVTGRYFEDCNEAIVTTDPDADHGVRPHALGPEDAARLWDVSLHMIA